MPGYAYQRNTPEYSTDEQLEQDSEFSQRGVSPGLYAYSPPASSGDAGAVNKGSAFYIPIFSTFIKEIGNQWWAILTEKWRGELALLDLSPAQLSQFRSIFTDTTSSLLVRVIKLENVILESDADSNEILKIQEVLSIFRQVLHAVEGVDETSLSTEYFLSIFSLANKMLENEYFKSVVGHDNARLWKSRVEQGERTALLFAKMSTLSSDNPLAYVEAILESDFSPVGAKEIITHMRELFHHLDNYYQTQVSRHGSSPEISSLGNYLSAYEQEDSVHKKFLVLVELMMDENVFDSVQPIIDQVFPDASLGLRLTQLIKDDFPESSQGASSATGWVLPASNFLDSDFRAKMHQEITVSNSAVGNMIDSMLGRTENFLNLDGAVVKLISAFFKFKNSQATWKDFSSAMFSGLGDASSLAKNRVSSFVSSQTHMAKETVDDIISKITNIDYSKILQTPVKDYPGLFVSAIYNELPDAKQGVYYLADMTPYGKETRLAVESVGQIIESGGARWWETLLQSLSAYGKNSILYKVSAVFINAGLAGMMWSACSDASSPEIRSKNIKQAQQFLDTVLRYLPSHGFEHIRELANWLPILHSIRENIKDVPDIENGNIASWARVVLARLEDTRFADNEKVNTLRNDIRERLLHWTTTLSGRVGESVNIAVDKATAGSSSASVPVNELAADTQSMSSASAHSMQIQSGMNSALSDNKAGSAWGKKAAIAATATAAGGVAAYAAYKLIKRNGKNNVEINPGEFTDEQLGEERVAIKKTLGQVNKKRNIAKGITIGSGVVSGVVLSIAAVVRAKKLYESMRPKEESTQPAVYHKARSEQTIFDTEGKFQRVYNWDSLSVSKAQESFISEKWSSIQKNEKALWFAGLGMLLPAGVAGWKWYDYAQQITQLDDKLAAIEIEEIKRVKTKGETTSYYDALAFALDLKYNFDTAFKSVEEIEEDLKVLLTLPVDELNEMNSKVLELVGTAADSKGRGKRSLSDNPITGYTSQGIAIRQRSYFDRSRSSQGSSYRYRNDTRRLQNAGSEPWLNYAEYARRIPEPVNTYGVKPLRPEDDPVYKHSYINNDNSRYPSYSTNGASSAYTFRPEISSTTTTRLAQNLKKNAEQELAQDPDLLNLKMASALEGVEQQVDGIPRHLSGPLPYVAHEGSKLFTQYKMPDKFNPEKEISIGFKKWNDNPWHWFLSLLTYTNPIFVALEETGITSFRDAFRASSENQNIALQDLLLGKLKNIIGQNTYDISFPQPQQLYKDMYNYNLQDRYMKELGEYLSKNGDKSRKGHREVIYNKIRNKFKYEKMFAGEDIIKLLKEKKVVIFRSKLNYDDEKLFNTFILHDMRENNLGHEYYVFSLNDNRPVTEQLVRKKEQFMLTNFSQAFMLLQGSLHAPSSSKHLMEAMSDQFLNEARRDVKSGHNLGYTEEMVDAIAAVRGPSWIRGAMHEDMRFGRHSRIHVKNGELDFSEDFDEMIERLKDEVDEAAVSDSEAQTLAGLYYFELAVNIFTTILALASLATLPSSGAISGTIGAVARAISTYSGPVAIAATVLTTTGINVTRAAIANNSEEYQNALVQMATNIFYEAAAYLGGKFIPVLAKRIPMPKVSQAIKEAAVAHTETLLGKLYDTAGLQYANDIRAKISSELNKLPLVR